jgi:hypothetical protein
MNTKIALVSVGLLCLSTGLSFGQSPSKDGTGPANPSPAQKIYDSPKESSTTTNASGVTTSGSANTIGAPQEAGNRDEQGAFRLESSEPSGATGTASGSSGAGITK